VSEPQSPSGAVAQGAARVRAGGRRDDARSALIPTSLSWPRSLGRRVRVERHHDAPQTVATSRFARLPRLLYVSAPAGATAKASRCCPPGEASASPGEAEPLRVPEWRAPSPRATSAGARLVEECTNQAVPEYPKVSTTSTNLARQHRAGHGLAGAVFARQARRLSFVEVRRTAAVAVLLLSEGDASHGRRRGTWIRRQQCWSGAQSRSRSWP
jgi:hypothetical protein